jgi:hypothetical protein
MSDEQKTIDKPVVQWVRIGDVRIRPSAIKSYHVSRVDPCVLWLNVGDGQDNGYLFNGDQAKQLLAFLDSLFEKETHTI